VPGSGLGEADPKGAGYDESVMAAGSVLDWTWGAAPVRCCTGRVTAATPGALSTWTPIAQRSPGPGAAPTSSAAGHCGERLVAR